MLSLAIGGVAAVGAYVALGRIDVGPDDGVVQASNGSLAERAAQLDTMEANLEAALAKSPPKLPPIPEYPPVKKPPGKAPKVVTLVSYVPDVTYKKVRGKGEHDKDYAKRQREAERRRAERQREAERRRAEKQREAEKKQREAERRRAEKKREAEKKRREEHKP